MLVLTWMYNDLGGANENYFLRNILNALGFMCYSSGSTTVAAGYGIWDRNERSHIWLAIIGAIVFSTLQIQDMPDMKGDLARGRRTLPLVHGQRIARVSIALPVLFWSFVCPFYWELNLWAYALPVVLGSTLAGRVLLLTTTHADRLTWKLWCIWVMALYLLPLCKDYTIFRRFMQDIQKWITLEMEKHIRNCCFGATILESYFQPFEISSLHNFRGKGYTKIESSLFLSRIKIDFCLIFNPLF
ncbi:hypothetical protein EAE99_010794 [Botrytis elliptica]|nr:hypothetical protein EAE99_010794 [Botrytis elliptica]